MTTHRTDGTDQDLLAAVGRKDRSAFDALYQRYESRVHAYLKTFVRDAGTAEELLIDTLTAVWDGAGHFAGRSLVSTWILGIARHKALDAVRRGARLAPTVQIEPDTPLPDPAPGPAESVQQADAQRVVRAALGSLSAAHQEVLRLAFFEELPYGDIATLLGIPANTVKSRVFYAKEQLRVALVAAGASRSLAP